MRRKDDMRKCLELTNASEKLYYCLTEDNGVFSIYISCDLFEDNQTALFNNITVNRIIAEKLISILADYAVLPTNAGDVIEDYICEAYLI